MSTQIFKNNKPNELLFELLDKICLKNEKHYIFNTDSFKKGIYNTFIEEFIQGCLPYYHISKRKYLGIYILKKLYKDLFSLYSI